MVIYLELLAVVFIAVVPGFLYFFLPERLRKRRRTSVINSPYHIIHSIGVCCLILYIALQQETGILSVGLDRDKLDLLFAGLLLAIFFLLLVIVTTKVIFKKKETESGKNFEKEVLLYKSMPQKALLLIYVSLAAISEEFIFRGYFILIWGQRTGYPIICAFISSIIFILLHLHRGKKAIPYYTAITAFLVIPTLYTHTILISIGMHLYINILLTLGVWIRESKKRKEEHLENSTQQPKSTFVPPPPVPYSKSAILLFICSWIAIPFSILLFGIPSAIIICLAIFNIIRLKKKKEKKVGIGFCIGTIAVSILPIFAIIAFFGLPYILDFIFSSI